ncbi:histamine H3 receptor-like [Empidonax traillii]|uniref:histamine H3 receptor-like n=1 Tax=Empidonax traillii TaxID=164674 RepID=UPI000FFD1BED|nr:histamine H3 receptor-like [Empidonax traillii]
MHNSTAGTLQVAAVCNETWPTQSPSSEFSLGVLVLLAVLMVLLCLVTILGNVLVILAFIVDRSLRHQSNYFFLNLAVSDLAVGVFCIPLYIPYSLTGKWHLGRGVCKLWLVMDYLLCTASVFNIVLISYDRFLSVTRAVSYRARQGITSNPAIKMVAIWILAFLLYCPAILLWEHVAGQSASLVTDCSSPSRGNSVTPENEFSVSLCSKARSKLQQDKKIAKSLTIIVCVFAICWAPYSLLMIVRGACQGTCVHNTLYEATFWLLWINSSLNPFLYPLCHVKFRMAFLKILSPKKFATLRSGSF